VPVVVRRVGRQYEGRRVSGRGCEGDGVAECFELADVAAFLDVRVCAAAEVIGAEITEPGVRILQQVPDDDEDGASDQRESASAKAAGSGSAHGSVSAVSDARAVGAADRGRSTMSCLHGHGGGRIQVQTRVGHV
jgi:hypothetical protein